MIEKNIQSGVEEITVSKEESFSIKKEILPKESKKKRRFARFMRFVNKYKILISIISLGLAIVASFTTGAVNLNDLTAWNTTRQLSVFYQKSGDRLLEAQQLPAAEKAYYDALALDKNNKAARYGLAKAQVFQPVKNEKYTNPEVVDIRLADLREKFKDDYQVSFLQAVREEDTGSAAAEEKFINESLKEYRKNNKGEFIMGHVLYGALYQRTGRIPEAIDKYKDALKTDPDNVSANNGLGSCYLIQKKFNDAYKYLSISEKRSPTMDIYLSLGDVYLYFDDVDDDDVSLQIYTDGLKQIEESLKDTKLQAEYYLNPNGWFYNYFPLVYDDKQPDRILQSTDSNFEKNVVNGKFTQTIGEKRYQIKQTIALSIKNKTYDLHYYYYPLIVSKIEEEYALFLYSASFAYAIQGDFVQADKFFEKANQQSQNDQFPSYIANKMYFITQVRSLDEKTKTWFMNHIAEVLTPSKI